MQADQVDDARGDCLGGLGSASRPGGPDSHQRHRDSRGDTEDPGDLVDGDAAGEQAAQRLAPSRAPGVVGAAGAEQVQGRGAGRVGEDAIGVRDEAWPVAQHPDQAEDLVPGPDCDRHPVGERRVGALELHRARTSDHRLVLGGVGRPVRGLPTQDGQAPDLVDLLAGKVGVGHHPPRRLLDRDRPAERRRDRVGEGEQVPRGGGCRVVGLDPDGSRAGRGHHRVQVAPGRLVGSDQHGQQDRPGVDARRQGRDVRAPALDHHGPPAGGRDPGEGLGDTRLGLPPAGEEHELVAQLGHGFARPQDDRLADGLVEAVLRPGDVGEDHGPERCQHLAQCRRRDLAQRGLQHGRGPRDHVADAHAVEQ